MNKSLLTGVLMAMGIAASAQNKVITKSFDLESIKKNKGWNLYSGFSDANGNPVIKIGQSKCDQVTQGSTVTTYGLAWDFEELTFDKELSFIKSTPKSFANTMEALQYEPVWGRTFGASNISLTAGVSLGGLKGSDLGKTFVSFTGNVVGGVKVSSVRLETEVKGVMNSKGTAAIGCNQYPTLNVLSSESVKDQKGQKWAAAKNFSSVGSAIGFFQVSGDGFPADKFNIAAKKFNSSLQGEKELILNIDFNTTYDILAVEKPNNEKDFVLVFQSCNKYAPKGIPVKDADYAELYYIDGNTLEIKLKQVLKLPYTKWFAREAILTQNDELFVFGPAGKDNKSHTEMPGNYAAADFNAYKNIVNDPENSPNLLVVKIKDNKFESIVANTIEDASKVLKVVEGSSKKSKNTPIFNYPSTAENANVFSSIKKYNRRIYYKNNKLIVCYQAHVKGSTSKPPTYGDMTIAIFDNTGKVEKMYILPENDYSNFEEYFSADDKKMYWITHDYLSLNKQTLGPGWYEAKKVPNMIATIPQLSIIDLTNYNATPLQKISSEEWGIDAANPVVVNTEQDLIFQGKSTAKKAKDSDIVLIRVEK
jgi:hypothetical protein